MKRKLLAILTAVVFFAGTALAAQAERNVGMPYQHYLGWECIHSREAPVAGWFADTGNGYYGGLQMEWNWMGVINGGADNYSPMAQMMLAEMEAARYGFSYSFMEGQWPLTYPPCAQYFST